MLVPSIFSNNFVDDIFDDVFPFGAYNVPAADNRAAMNTDVKEFDDRYELEFELPGVKKEDIQAELKDGYLIVNAKHQDNKDEKGKDGKYFAHTLNNTVVAPPRMLIAFLENNLNADGTVNIPEVLQPYMGGMKVIK